MWKVVLTDGKTYTQENTSWITLPNFSIVSLMYNLPNGKSLYFKGFDSYLYLHEDYHLFYGVFNNKQVRDTENLLSRKGDRVVQLSYSVRFNKMYQIENKWGKEFRPLQIKNGPTLEPKKRITTIDFGSARPTNKNLWHLGVHYPQAIAKII